MASDTLPTVWPADPHTLAKHRILSNYLKAWMPILANSRNVPDGKPPEILFIDGFAGPGVYEGGEDGSPVIALKTALDHSRSFSVPVSFLFIEQDDERFARLVSALEGLKPRIEESPNVRLLPPYHGDCGRKLNELLDTYKAQRRDFGPALVFLDQFGYSKVPMDLIGRIMSQPRCEVFAYMNWNRLNPYFTDETKWPTITRAFGSEAWKSCLSFKGGRRDEEFLKSYSEQLRTAGKSDYVWHFAMCGEGDQLLYWLFFCTNNLLGLKEMKKAMFSVDESGGFRFSDGNDPNQLSFFKGATQEWLAEHLHKKFSETTQTIAAIRVYVLTETPCYKFKEALALLEDAQRIRVVGAPANRKKKSFADEGMSIAFVRGPAKQIGFFDFD